MVGSVFSFIDAVLSCPENGKETPIRTIKHYERRNVQCVAVFKNQPLLKCKRVSKLLNLSSSDVWETGGEGRYQRLFGIPDITRPPRPPI